MAFRILIVILIIFAIDVYVFQGIRLIMKSSSVTSQRIGSIVYWAMTLLCVSVILIGFVKDWHSWDKHLRTYAFAFIVIVYLSKIVVVPFLLLDDVLRLFRWTGGYIGNAFAASGENKVHQTGYVSRYDFLVKAGLIVGAIPFLSLIYGMFRGAYNYQVRNLRIQFPHLPEAFDGIRILQISDLHVGSFIGSEHLETAVDLILKHQPDLIFFTGDLVNDLHSEVLEFTPVLKKIQAPMGVYSILGNHDYGDYYRWNSQEEKNANLDRLKKYHGELGWNILLNGHTFIEKSGDKIGLIGVENWSSRANFKKYGDMKIATEAMTPAAFNILLSHDPSHWNSEITEKYRYVDLTLSGHTHGFQFGVEIPGFKWSPVQYMYKEWADLYKNDHQYLYVNRGLGFIGYPGRVGILPEITVFTLNRA